MESGVPQGSVLGPLLFLILIGDIDEEVSSSFLSSFADDTRIGHGISSSQDETTPNRFWSRLQMVKENNMEFNSDKFEHVHYKAKNSEEPIPKYNSNNGTPFETKSHVRDLGITISSNASFTDHISERITVLKLKIGWILRTFQTREVLPMLTLWKQLVLCDHDYWSQLWNPDRVGDIQSLELLQGSFIRKIKGMQHLSYWEQLQSLKLYSLERRRERYALLYTWRILYGSAPNISEGPTRISSKWHPRRGRIRHVPNVLPSAPPRIQSIRRASFGIKGPQLFNSLPIHLRTQTRIPVDKFKAMLDQFVCSVPDQPLIPGYTKYRTVNTNSIIDWVAHARLQSEGSSTQKMSEMLTLVVAPTVSP